MSKITEKYLQATSCTYADLLRFDCPDIPADMLPIVRAAFCAGARFFEGHEIVKAGLDFGSGPDVAITQTFTGY